MISDILKERDFNGTEQVNGLELALAEPKKDIRRIKMLANEQSGRLEFPWRVRG